MAPRTSSAAALLEPHAKRICPRATTVAEYRKTLQDQGKYSDCKPGSRSLDGCLKDPPLLPPSGGVMEKKAPVPERHAEGYFVFPDHPSFKPNLSPKEVMQMGAFGGTYYRDIISAVTGESYKGKDVIKEFPSDWFEGLDLDTAVTSPVYQKFANKYKVACGASLGQWECSGWISPLDPYGWFQWYCRFFLGRRSTDDDRQIDRWEKGQGPTGRWRTRFCNELIKAGAKYDNVKVSPVIRQTMLHWAYSLTEEDLKRHTEK